MANTSMLHVRIDNELKDDAAKTLANIGLTLSDAVRILLTRITKEGGLPAGLTVDPAAHQAWFEAQVKKALIDTNPSVSHQEVMDDVQAIINKKRKHD